MARKTKPAPDLVSKASDALKHPGDASKLTIKRMAAIVLDDQHYDPRPHKTTPKAKKPTRKSG